MGRVSEVGSDRLGANLKRAIRRHLDQLGFSRTGNGSLLLPRDGKDAVRSLHSRQRSEKLRESTAFIKRVSTDLLPYFADGIEIDPSRIRLRLERVRSGTSQADLFRLASLTWSVPVSPGYGRRIRYIVWDDEHDRIAGIIALGDPVFNLSVRDSMIGWSAAERSKRLVNVLDAYVLGAVPPYNALLGGKAVACMVRSREIFEDFKAAYGTSTGVISGDSKKAKLLMVTTTSSMGRSSVYNRLKLDGTRYFSHLGYTIGWGHFHISEKLFEHMREYLRMRGHSYADANEFGEGPNWRLRTIRAALTDLGLNGAVLRHGVKREVFMCTLTSNALSILKSGKGKPDLADLRSVDEISDMARTRWIVPRSLRDCSYLSWRRSQILPLISGAPRSP